MTEKKMKKCLSDLRNTLQADMQTIISNNLLRLENRNEHDMLQKYVVDIAIKHKDKNKQCILFIKTKDRNSINNNYAFNNILSAVNVTLIEHNGELDNMNLIDIEDFKNRFNNLFRGQYKIVKDKSK